MTATRTTNGYQAGGGVEYALGGDLTVTGEYIYTSLEADSLSSAWIGVGPGDQPLHPGAQHHGHGHDPQQWPLWPHHRLGMNYRF